MLTSVFGQDLCTRIGTVLVVGFAGLVFATPILAADEGGPESYEEPSSDQMFQDAGMKLSDELGRLNKECCDSQCAPPEPVSCESCDSCCGSSCGSGCGCLGGCCLGEPWSLSSHLFGDCDHGIHIGGWMQWGYHSEGNGLFNSHPNDVNLHQGWLYAEKAADGSQGHDWGFRVDMMYGVDASDTQAFGNPPGSWDFDNGFDHGIYGWAIPQLYVELASGDWSIKAGHFFTLIGYEVVTAPDNFFYSHAYTMYNSEPFTHTGVLTTYSAHENVEFYAGWTAGWDTGFDAFDDGSNFLGGASFTLTEYATFTYINTLGDFGARGEGYSHSLVLDLTLTDNMNYVVQSDLVETNAGADHQYGLNQYLFYTINDCLKAGVRGEWWKNGDNSQYEVTAGVNVRTHANLVIRPEVRRDWNPNLDQEFTTFGVDAIVTF